jgi:hypothetical protein
MTDEFRLTELGRWTEAKEAAAAALKARGEALNALLRLLRPAAECGVDGFRLVPLDLGAMDAAVMAVQNADGALRAAVSDANHAAEIVRRPGLTWAR